MLRPGLSLTLALTLAVAGSACSANNSSSAYQNSGGTGGGSGGTDGGIPADASIFDGSSMGDAQQPEAKTHLHGMVVAPEGTIPISGALVYVSGTLPDAIPDGTFCDRCVKIQADTPYTYTAADGTFDLPTWSTGDEYLIVQKGQFRRVRPITIVTEGDQDVPLALTTLPGRMDKANGDDIPRMAIVPGAWDKIDVTLAKLGLANITAGGLLTGPKVDYATAGFDYYQPTHPLDPNDPLQPTKLLTDPSVLSKYHIVFIPCNGNTGDGPWCATSESTQGAVQQNLQQFVATGGKLYVTDFSYEFVRQLFPGYISWVDETSTIGSACMHGSWDAPAQVQDQGLQEWLTAMGLTSWNVQANWTQISGVHEMDTTDMDGNPTKVTPKIWVVGEGPSTVSFERSCGRVLFSTYHTEADQGSTTSLLPQEKALLYILLEVGVCVAPPDIK